MCSGCVRTAEMNASRTGTGNGKRSYTPRTPTDAELIEILGANCEQYGLEEEESAVLGAYIAVFDNYITGGPGFAGKVAVAVFDGSPEFIESYVWIDGKCKVAGSGGE